jgi:hypothetical protein
VTQTLIIFFAPSHQLKKSSILRFLYITRGIKGYSYITKGMVLMKMQMTKYITIQILDNEQTSAKNLIGTIIYGCYLFEIF